MKHTKKLTTLLLSLGIAGGLNAAITPNVELVTDGSFEIGTEEFGAGNANRLNLTNWFEANADPAAGEQTGDNVEALQGGGVNNTPTANNGTFWLNLATNSGADAEVYQLLGTWNTGNPTVFNFSAVLGDRSNVSFGQLNFELFKTTANTGADGSALTTLSGAAQVADFGTFDDTGLSNGGSLAISALNVSAVGLVDGDFLWIRITENFSNSGTQSLVDSVSVIAVPEPSTYALIGGVLALGLVMYRRRKA